jgi:hypothetical protein
MVTIEKAIRENAGQVSQAMAATPFEENSSDDAA